MISCCLIINIAADIAHLTLKDIVDDTSEPKTDTVIKCTKAEKK
jgi:hypothetical protein